MEADVAMSDNGETRVRCFWVGQDPLMVRYHDEEWGIPCHQDLELFERLMLEAFQAGLSWVTILRRREQFRRAFQGWDPNVVAAYGPEDVARLLEDPGIIRNRLKIMAAISNSRRFLAVQEEWGSFDRYIWSLVGGRPLLRDRPPTPDSIPATTPESDAMSKELKRRGFTFVGSTICYAFMQSIGMVNDHVEGCFMAARRGEEGGE